MVISIIVKFHKISNQLILYYNYEYQKVEQILSQILRGDQIHVLLPAEAIDSRPSTARAYYRKHHLKYQNKPRPSSQKAHCTGAHGQLSIRVCCPGLDYQKHDQSEGERVRSASLHIRAGSLPVDWVAFALDWKPYLC